MFSWLDKRFPELGKRREARRNLGRALCIAAAVCTLAAAPGVDAEETGTGRIDGKWITSQNGPVTGGKALFFNEASGPPPQPELYWRSADQEAEIDGEGRFSAELPQGNYFVGTVKRKGDNDRGPLQEGDRYALFREGIGNPKLFPVRSGKTTDIGTITSSIPYSKSYRLEGMTAIEGRVLDEEENPAAGVVVVAYLNPDMAGRPIHVSDPTDCNGAYLLRIAEGGTFYLKTRNRYGGGRPEKGEVMGGYGDQLAPVAVTVETGAVRKGIDIKGRRFPGRGPSR